MFFVNSIGYRIENLYKINEFVEIIFVQFTNVMLPNVFVEKAKMGRFGTTVRRCSLKN